MYSLPQEIEVWYVIPSIRRQLASILAKKHKIRQREIAEFLGTSEAAISQYLSKKRAKEIKFPGEMKKDFEDGAKEIIKNRKNAIKEIMKLVDLAKKNGVSCCMCKKYNKGVLSMCSCSPEKEKKGG